MPLLDYPPYNIARRIPGVPEPTALWVAGQASSVKAWDSSVRGVNHGTLNGGVTTSGDGWGVLQNGWSMSGSGKNISLGLLSASTNITLWAVVNLTATGAIQFVCSNDNALGGSNDRLWQFRVDATGVLRNIFFSSGATNGQAVSAASVVGVGPVFIAATWDGTTIRNYINGSPDGTAALAGPAINTASAAATLGNGSNNAGTGQLTGQMYAFGLHRSTLSAAQVSALYRRLRFGVPPRKQVYSYVSGGSSFRFRRTLSPLGTRTGSRQVMA